MAATRMLYELPQLAIRDIACRMPRGGPGAGRGGEGTHLVFVRHGAFVAHVGRRAYIADPRTALVSWAGLEYRLSHPGAHGDDCTVLELAPALADELLRRRPDDLEVPLAPAVQAHYAQLLATIARGDAFAIEEVALGLAGAVTRAGRVVGPVRARRAAVQHVRALLDADPTTRVSVADLAAAVGVSPYHLMRLFKIETGTTLRAYRLQLRLALALHRLREGERDLAALAADLGFASHAHLTDTFTRLLGRTPRHVRASLLGSAP